MRPRANAPPMAMAENHTGIALSFVDLTKGSPPSREPGGYHRGVATLTSLRNSSAPPYPVPSIRTTLVLPMAPSSITTRLRGPLLPVRIVLAPFGSRGDLQPFLALGQALRAKGHDVLVAAAPSYRQWVEEEGLGFREAGGDLESWLRRRGRTATRPLSLYRALAAFVRDGAPLWFQQTCAAVRDADLVVATLHLAARSAAEALRIPCRTVLFTPQLLPSRAHPPPGIPAVSLPGRINRVLWSAFARVFDGSFRGAIDRERAKLGLPPIRSFLAHARGTSPIVASDPELAPLPADADSQPVQTGAIVSRADGPLSDELEAFLAAGEPPVYVGFGSMPDRAPELTSRLIAEAVRGAGRRAIL